LDYAKVHKKSRQAASRLAKGVEFLLKKNNVEVIKATAVIASAGKLAMSSTREIPQEVSTGDLEEGLRRIGDDLNVDINWC